MKKFLIPAVMLVIVAVVVVSAVMPNTAAATKKLETEIQTAMKDGKTVFLQLSSTGCVTCRKMKPQFEKLMAGYEQSDDFYITNVDVDAHPSLASKFSVNAVPTQIIISTKGKQLFRNTGYMSYDNMQYALKSAAE